MVATKRKEPSTKTKPNGNHVDHIPSTERRSKRTRTQSKPTKAIDESQDEYDDSDKEEEKEEEEESDDIKNEKVVESKPSKIDIPHPKGSPYADALSPKVLEFLADLKENNTREFMLSSQDRWKDTQKEFIDFVGMLMEQLHDLDPTIQVENPKLAVYRQHRDLRFTNDLRPYKTYLSASFSRGGRKSPFAGYYFAVAPGGGTYIGAGIWQPSANRLQNIRQGIIENAALLREALSLEEMDKVFGKHGVELLEETDKLKTAPRNIDKDHPEIELLRYKSLVISKKFDDLDVVSEGFLDKVLDVYEAVVPFVTVLNSWTG
ncbi:hypothetical protein CLU79DRAFT_738356 [Phycomyces nitens]|nr:hypothetical protein CLU79DRAFT_738356 [Phycomyces nitens]